METRNYVMSDQNVHNMQSGGYFQHAGTSSHAGKCIKALRLTRGWSQEDVAGKMGISVPAFSKIETGVTDVNLSRLEQIANVYEVSLVQLFLANEKQDERLTAQAKILHNKLVERESEILVLQRKVIELLEAIHKR